MDSDVLASMYAYIVRGGSKQDCPYVTDDETGAAFDAIEGEVKAAREANPDVQFDVPHEIPGQPNTPVSDLAASPPTTAPSDAEEEPEPEDEPDDEDDEAEPKTDDEDGEPPSDDDAE